MDSFHNSAIYFQGKLAQFMTVFCECFEYFNKRVLLHGITTVFIFRTTSKTQEVYFAEQGEVRRTTSHDHVRSSVISSHA